MNKCLVTKLKAEVNNPNLPVFEPIYQFTLDAITASGNSSMTDAQVKVLNKFFINIGAVNNSGIYTKMDMIFLPCICNQNVQKSFVNYKDLSAEVPYSANQWQYKGSGIVKHSSVTSNYGVINLANIADFDSANRSVSIGYYRPDMPLSRDTSQFFINTDASDDTKIINSNIVYLATKREDSVMYNSYRIRQNAQDAQFEGAVISVSSGVASGVLIKSSGNITPVIETSGTDVSINGTVTTKQYINEWPFGIMLYGHPLTESEQTTLANSIREVIEAFEITNA